MLDDNSISVEAEPFLKGKTVSRGDTKSIRVEVEKANQYEREKLVYDMPISEYDDRVTEIMVELFYARNKADLIGKEDVDNPHQKAKETVKKVMTNMMEGINNEFDESRVDNIIDGKRQVQEKPTQEKDLGDVL